MIVFILVMNVRTVNKMDVDHVKMDIIYLIVIVIQVVHQNIIWIYKTMSVFKVVTINNLWIKN